MFRLARSFHSITRINSRAVSNRIIIPPKNHYSIGQQSLKALKSEYKQLPENANYIEKFYHELEIFHDEFLVPKLNKHYTDFEENPDDLVFELEKFIELHVIPRHSVSTDTSDLMANGINLPMVYCETVRDKLVIERFLDFCRSVRNTLRMNGGHSFIFDVMLQSNSVFQDFEKNKYQAQSE